MPTKLPDDFHGSERPRSIRKKSAKDINKEQEERYKERDKVFLINVFIAMSVTATIAISVTYTKSIEEQNKIEQKERQKNRKLSMSRIQKNGNQGPAPTKLPIALTPTELK